MGLFDALGGIVSGITGNKQRKQEAQKAREYDKYQTDLKWSRDQQAVKDANEYNSPKNQYARYKGSGLNPALMAGGQPMAAQASPKSEKASAIYAQPQNIPIKGMGGLESFMQIAQIKNIKAQTDYTNANTDYLKGAKTGGTEATTAGTLQDTKFKKWTQDNLQPIVKERMETQLEGLKSDNIYKAYVAKLADDGFNTNDNTLLRMAYLYLKKQGKDPVKMTVEAIEAIIKKLTEAPEKILESMYGKDAIREGGAGSWYDQYKNPDGSWKEK